jgi:hypothetical protein
MLSSLSEQRVPDDARDKYNPGRQYESGEVLRADSAPKLRERRCPLTLDLVNSKMDRFSWHTRTDSQPPQYQRTNSGSQVRWAICPIGM